MSKISRKLIDDLKTKWAGLETAIDGALDKGITTGYALCEDQSGNIILDSVSTSDEGELGLHIRCLSHGVKHKASIIITPKT